MDMVARISKGTLMDQIYIPKNRSNLPTGSYVLLTAMPQNMLKEVKLNFYNTSGLEPIKLEIIQKVVKIIDRFYPKRENIIIAGSFLDKGFTFNDLDIILITSENQNKKAEEEINKKIGIHTNIEIITYAELIQGLNYDPLYRAIISKCISEKKLIFKVKNKYNYKLLDLHLLKSKYLLDNFDYLTGKEKYKMIRNMISIKMFLENKIISLQSINKEIASLFNLKNIEEIKENILNKKEFLRIYKHIYSNLFNKILDGVKNDSKQK